MEISRAVWLTGEPDRDDAQNERTLMMAFVGARFDAALPAREVQPAPSRIYSGSTTRTSESS